MDGKQDSAGTTGKKRMSRAKVMHTATVVQSREPRAAHTHSAPSRHVSPPRRDLHLHVIMAIRNTEFFEVLLPHGAQKYGLVQDIVVGGDGLVHAPTAPGLGYEIDFDLIERKKISILK